MKSKLRKITSAHVISVIALFVALGGTVYAAGGFNGKLIRKGSIPGNRLKANSLTGGQIAEESLGTVPAATSASKATEAVKAVEATKSATATNASHADNATHADKATRADSATSADNATSANNLNGVPAGQFQRACQSGSVKGSVIVNSTGLPAQFTQVPGFNCDGQEISARRIEKGVYQIKFAGGAGGAGTALVSLQEDVGVVKVKSESVGGETVFRVEVFLANTNGTHEEGGFLTLMAI
jgi:hypothetical protein